MLYICVCLYNNINNNTYYGYCNSFLAIAMVKVLPG